MAVVYRTAGAWGAGLGTNLTAAQVDNNFWQLVSDIAGLTERVAATGVLTLAANAVAAETVTIGSRVYTWRAAVGATADEVLIGASASASIDNLIAAINNAAGAGTLYGTGTAVHSTVFAAVGAGDTMIAEARVEGEFGNTIATSETMTNGSWSDVTLTGGAGIGPDMIESIAVIGSQMTFFMQSGSTFGPFTLPIAMIHWRGNWVALDDYSELDLVVLPKTTEFPGVYLVRVTHTAGATFDPALLIGGVAVYHKLIAISGESNMNFTGDYSAGGSYSENDVFETAGSAWIVLKDHTAAPTFDADALSGGDPLYHQLWTTGGLPTEGDLKDSVVLATLGNVALTGEQTIDDVLTSGTDVLVKENTNKSENGIYTTAAGAWTRRADADTDAEVTSGMLVFVESGTVNAGKMFVLTTPNPIVLNTTDLNFSSFDQATTDTRPNLVITAAGNTNIRASSDHNKRTLVMNSASAQSLTFDNLTGIGNGQEVWVIRIGAGAVSLIASGGISFQAPVGAPADLTRYAFYRFRKYSSTKWQQIGPTDWSDGIANQSTVLGVSVSDALEQLESEIVSGGGLPSKVNKAGDTMTGQLVVDAGTVAAPGLGIGDTDTGIYRTGADAFAFSFGGVQIITFNASGMGINASASAGIPLSISKLGTTCLISISGESTTQFLVEQASASVAGASFSFRKARGTLGARAFPNSGDTLADMIATGWSGSYGSSSGIARFSVIAASPSGTDMEARFAVFLDPAASLTVSEIYRMDHASGFSMYGANVIIDSNRIHRQRSYTIATLPAAANAGRGPVWVTDLGGGANSVVDDASRWKRMSETGAAIVSTDADYTWSPLTSPPDTLHNGTLTADRTITLSTTGAYAGAKCRVSRAATDNAFLLSVVGSETFVLGPNMVVDFVYTTGWFLQSSGYRVRQLQSIIVAVGDETTAITTGVGKVSFRMPYAMRLMPGAAGIKASLGVAQTSGTALAVDVNEAGTSIMTTSKLVFDNTEKTTLTAATPPALTDRVLAADAEITIDVDAVGDGTAKGLKVALIGFQT